MLSQGSETRGGRGWHGRRERKSEQGADGCPAETERSGGMAEETNGDRESERKRSCSGLNVGQINRSGERKAGMGQESGLALGDKNEQRQRQTARLCADTSGTPSWRCDNGDPLWDGDRLNQEDRCDSIFHLRSASLSLSARDALHGGSARAG